MPDLTKNELVISLGGTERIWRLDWKAIRELENAATQLSENKKRVVWQRFLVRFNDWTIDDWGLLLWAGLHRKDKTITYDYVMEEADLGTLGAFQLQFNEIVFGSVPERFKKKSQGQDETLEIAPSPETEMLEAEMPETATAQILQPPANSSAAEKSAPEVASVSA